MRQRGFTIIEIIITVSVMAILLALGIASTIGIEEKGRDSERKADVESIAMHLETFYTSGSDALSGGSYPSLQMIGQEQNYLRDIDDDNLKAPGQDTSSFIAATNNLETTSTVTPQPTINQYVYQPVDSGNALCSIEVQGCVRFNIYYMSEADNIVHQVKSKNQ